MPNTLASDAPTDALRGPWRALDKRQWPKFGARIHPELNRALQIAAIQEDMSVEEFIHRTLCHVLNREDLTLQAPSDAN